jgi:uncharacterized integral membrane protein
MIAIINKEPTTYEGQFGEFTIDKSDRTGVIIYRAGLIIAALSFALATNLVVAKGVAVLPVVTPLFALFSLALAISLLTIHIYLEVLHRTLQAFWVIGSISAIVIAVKADEPLALYVYNHPLTLLGIGFTFAALTGIYFKEAFCFNRLETKVLTPIVPFLLLGHLTGLLPFGVEQVLLAIWTIGFTIFAGRKMVQEIDPDIGDKSVFTYLKQQKH